MVTWEGQIRMYSILGFASYEGFVALYRLLLYWSEYRRQDHVLRSRISVSAHTLTRHINDLMRGE